ncbi:MAG: hypothetical protein JRH20_22105 [Deltaproteobacteria bacterium]|nr:hypothetical protein [Deltaproteobacteria bacterium]
MKRKTTGSTLTLSAFALSMVFTLGLLNTSCKENPTTKSEVAKSAVAKSTVAPIGKPAVKKSKVAKVIFIGKKEACDCTRKRVDDSWKALQSAISGKGTVPVERLAVDVDKVEVAGYRKMRAIMVLPAIYLLDKAGALVKLLQGEVTVEQAKKAMGG